jgi:hypothetical protein
LYKNVTIRYFVCGTYGVLSVFSELHPDNNTNHKIRPQNKMYLLSKWHSPALVSQEAVFFLIDFICSLHNVERQVYNKLPLSLPGQQQATLIK